MVGFLRLHRRDEFCGTARVGQLLRSDYLRWHLPRLLPASVAVQLGLHQVERERACVEPALADRFVDPPGLQCCDGRRIMVNSEEKEITRLLASGGKRSLRSRRARRCDADNRFET